MTRKSGELVGRVVHVGTLSPPRLRHLLARVRAGDHTDPFIGQTRGGHYFLVTRHPSMPGPVGWRALRVLTTETDPSLAVTFWLGQPHELRAFNDATPSTAAPGFNAGSN